MFGIRTKMRRKHLLTLKKTRTDFEFKAREYKPGGKTTNENTMNLKMGLDALLRLEVHLKT